MWFYLLGARFCFCYFLNHKLNAKDELSSQTAARTKNRYFFFVWRYLKVQTTTFNLVINCKENHNLNWSFHLNWHSCWPATWSHIMNTIHWMRFRQKMFLFYRECVIIWFNVSEREKNVFLQKKYRELNLSQDLSKYVESWSIEWSRIRTPMKELSGSCSQTCEIFDCHGSSKISRVFYFFFHLMLLIKSDIDEFQMGIWERSKENITEVKCDDANHFNRNEKIVGIKFR